MDRFIIEFNCDREVPRFPNGGFSCCLIRIRSDEGTMQPELEQKVFRQIYERQLERVYRLSLIYLKNVPDAEDAVQNIFLKMLEKEPVFQDENHETAWFVRVTRNYCRDVLRSFWKRNRISLEAVKEPAFEQFTKRNSVVFSAVMSFPPSGM